MDEPLLTLLKWCFLILIYVFFFRVLQVVWKGSTTRVSVQQVQSSKDFKNFRNPKKGVSSKAATKPSLIRVLEPSSRAGEEWVVDRELTIGRAETCDIVLEDSFISQVHAKLSKNDKGVVLEDLDSTNGTFLNNRKVRGSKQTFQGDRVRLGNILMEFR